MRWRRWERDGIPGDMLGGKGLSGGHAVSLRWPEWGQAMQGSEEELARQRRAAGVKDWGGSLFPKLHPVPKVLSASCALWVHPQVQKPLPPAERGLGSGDKLSQR